MNTSTTFTRLVSLVRFNYYLLIYLHSWVIVTKDYFENAEMLNHPFSAQHRLKLLQSIISSPVSDGGAGLDLDDLIKDGR